MKVSVIVPTYRTSEAGLATLVASLDRQTLSQDDFEVLLVDDGSPDDTLERLRSTAAQRPNYRVFARPNSGWPSAPRNFGLDQATGDYVAFSDHDDEFYPRALEAAYDYAILNNADVVNGKEAFTGNPDWALDTYASDQPQSLERTDRHPLIPMNPHKLYRRAFLLEHNLRFPEGRRALWEDGIFNVQVGAKADVVSTLASVPYYHWHDTEDGATNTAFSAWSKEYWHWVREMLDTTVSQLPGEDFALQRDQLLLHQYLTRILVLFNRSFERESAEVQEFLFTQSRAVQDDYSLHLFDDALDEWHRTRAHLLRHGDASAMARHCATSSAIPAIGAVTSAHWQDGVLHLEADVEWEPTTAPGLRLTRVDERLIRLPAEDLRDVLPSEACDATREVEGTKISLMTRSRASKIAWEAPSTFETWLVEEQGMLALRGRMSATLDPRDAAMGGPLEKGHWDLYCRARCGGFSRHKATRTMSSTIPATITITDGRLHLLYPSDAGKATVFTDGAREALRRLAVVSAELSPAGVVTVLLSGTHDGEGEVRTRVSVEAEGSSAPQAIPAVLRVSQGKAYVSFTAPSPHFSALIGDKTPENRASHTFSFDDHSLDARETLDTSVRRFQEAKSGARQLRVLLLTNNDSDNVGDQLIEECASSLIQGVMQNLGLPPEALFIESRASGFIPMKYLDTGKPSLLKSARTAISKADIIVFGGAPLFNYRYQRFYLRTIRTVELAQEYGVPVIFSSIGVEPYDEADERSMALKKALQLPVVRQITTRDDIDSVRKYVAETGIPAAHVADPVVLAETIFRRQLTHRKAAAPPAPTPSVRSSRSLRSLVPFPVKAAIRKLQGRPAPKRPTAPPNGKTIGLVVTRAGIFKDNGIDFPRQKQRQFWLDVIAALRARGYDYRLFTTGHFADETFLDELVQKESIPQSKVNLTVNSPEELIAELSACDGVIAYRLHASITSFALGVPAIGLSWNFKVPYFYDSIGYGGRALSHEHWTAKEVVPALEKAMREGVVQDEEFLTTVYSSLYQGLHGVFTPDAPSAAWSLAELSDLLPAYEGTTRTAYRAKLERKLRRVYDNYRNYAYR